MIYLYAVHLEQPDYEELDVPSLVSYISAERAKRAVRFIHKVDQIRCVFGEILLRYILWKHYHIASESVTFQYNEYGKPMLNEKIPLDFSISHSGTWLMCGVSENKIGIDVEENGKSQMLSIAKRCFTNEEYQYIKHQPESQQADAFYQIWTLKESYIKCIGKGLSESLQSFRFEINENQINLYQKEQKNSEYYFLSKKIEDEYHMAVCSYQKECEFGENVIQMISLQELLRWIHSM